MKPMFFLDYLLTVAIAMMLTVRIQDGDTIGIIVGVILLAVTPFFWYKNLN